MPHSSQFFRPFQEHKAFVDEKTQQVIFPDVKLLDLEKEWESEQEPLPCDAIGKDLEYIYDELIEV